MSTITRTFEREVGNDGTTRYYEQPEEGKERLIGHLDLPPSALRELGDPDALTVTITARRRKGDRTVILGSSGDFDQRVRPV